MNSKEICRLCKRKSELQVSHAIGNAVFKKISRKYSGKTISISNDEERINQYSSDSWAEKQLCKECETLLNEKYEQYGLGVLRAKVGDCIITENGVRFSNINLHKMNMYFLSILWRMACSSHPQYKGVYIEPLAKEKLRQALISDSQIPTCQISVKLSRLIDRTSQGGFSLTNLKEFIVSPFTRIKSSLYGQISYCLIFEGFFIEIFKPGLKSSLSVQPGVIRKSQNHISVPFIHVFDIPELTDLMVKAYGKQLNGKTKIPMGKS
ncbi:hypothetical protein [Aeromonas media]|uniref:hypothetical protein n=1 Tax=Aeromonas media TaxID=651 RepID=UPI003D054492